MSKSTLLAVMITAFVTSLIYIPAGVVLAEQSGNTPNSGVVSRIKSVYDSLVSLGHGTDSEGSWGNWGAMWNRIRSAGEWKPTGDAMESEVVAGKTYYKDSRVAKTGTLALTADADPNQVISGATFYNNTFSKQTGTLALTGDALASEVVSGKTFYSNSFTKLTGTAPAPFDYSTQRLVTQDDNLGTYQGEESTWAAVSGSSFAGFGALNLETGAVKQDSRTGLWWSASSTSTTYPTNQFTLSADGARPTGGQAIAFCDALNTASYGGKTDWYLPTQKELMTAYINGIYSQDPTFATTNRFWSSTEHSEVPGYAWYVGLNYGLTGNNGKGGGYSVRCVRRD